MELGEAQLFLPTTTAYVMSLGGLKQGGYQPHQSPAVSLSWRLRDDKPLRPLGWHMQTTDLVIIVSR